MLPDNPKSGSVTLVSTLEVEEKRETRASEASQPRKSTVTESFMDSVHEKVESIIRAPPPSASFGSTVFNLLKNFLGSTLLSLPDAFKYGSMLPSLVIFLLVAVVAASTMTLIAVLCHKHNATSYRDLWSKVVSPRSAPLVDLFICLNSVFSCVSYCLLIGQWMTQGLKDLLGDVFGHVAFNTIVVAVFVLYPLSLLRDLHPLRHTSVAGVICNIFGVSFVVWQAFYHGDERIPGRACGDLRVDNSCTSSEVWQASFFQPSVKMVSTFNMCASMMMAHYNVPKFYAEYHQRNPYAFGRAVLLAATIGTCLACSLSVAGVLRFGTSMPDNNILKHFNEQFPGRPGGIMSNTERVLTLCTWCIMSLNIIASFPLLFSPLRVSFLQLGNSSIESLTPSTYMMLTAGLLSVTVVFGLVVPTLTVITKFKGAICGMGIAYIFPALLLWKDSRGTRTPLIVFAVFAVLFVGGSLAIYGLVGAIESAFK